MFSRYSLPLQLTLLRLIISPLIVPFVFVYLLPYNNLYVNSALTAFFITIALTDFFDGYIARRLNQESDLGKLLDPVADKFLLYSTLISLLAVGKIYFFWVILFIGRDFFVTTIRSIALQKGFTIHVSQTAKYKTWVQSFMLAFIILNPYQSAGLWAEPYWNIGELCLLAIALLLTLISAYQYYRRFLLELDATTQEPLDASSLIEDGVYHERDDE